MLPCLKHAHKTRNKARAHLVSLKAKGGGRTRDLHVYRCACGAWHVGHRHRPRKLAAEPETLPKDLMVLVEEEI